jgi:hypothetical protein
VPAALAAYGRSLVTPSLRADIDVLRLLGPGHATDILAMPLWLEGAPPSWDQHLSRHESWSNREAASVSTMNL